jgi:hypothetical protein
VTEISFGHPAQSGQALPLSVILGLHLLDESYDEGLNHPVRHAFPSLLPPPSSYDELEECRRIFWMVHICAQMTSMQTLWPTCALASNEIYTCRPANDPGFGQIVWTSWNLQNYQLSVAMDLLPIRYNKLFDKSRVVYLLLSYV